MTLPPEEMARLRVIARARRRMSTAAQQRAELGALGIIDTGSLSDEDVIQALAVYRAALNDEEGVTVRGDV